MRAIKTTAILVVAVGLLAGSAVGSAAQEGITPVTVIVDAPEGCYYDELTAISTCPNVVIDASDDRLSGVAETTVYALDLPGSPEDLLGTITIRIENDKGAWFGVGTYGFVAGFEDDAWVLTGDGEYAGLSAYLALDGEEIRGAIVEGALALPPVE